MATIQSISQLPEAEKRLYICEKSFKKSYGDNLDRVVQLKGNAANEQALFMRLHLLMAVVMFHQNRRNESRVMLQMAESELSRLKVSDASLNLLVDMGYEVAESRIALRATQGVVEHAVTHIVNQRKDREEARRKSRAEKRLKIGRSKDKTWVNPRSLHVLVDMGFPQDLCEVALRKTDNNITRSVGEPSLAPFLLKHYLSKYLLPPRSNCCKRTRTSFAYNCWMTLFHPPKPLPNWNRWASTRP